MWLILLILLVGCSRSEVVETPPRELPQEEYTPKTKADSTDNRVPISFSVGVEGWKELIIE